MKRMSLVQIYLLFPLYEHVKKKKKKNEAWMDKNSIPIVLYFIKYLSLLHVQYS